jgi:hypothetical protein
VADTEAQDRVVSNDGQTYSGVTSTTQTTSDPVTGAAVSRSSTLSWSGRPLANRIVFIFLAFDFIFHAAGATNVGFAAFIFSIGGALAAPFAGIFKTTLTTPGTLIVWADILAFVVYAIAAAIVIKVISMTTDERARKTV